MTTGPSSERVRVTGPSRRRTPVTRTADIDDQTRLGGVYMGSLLREQLRLAIGILLVLALTVGVLPLLFHLAPELAEVHVLGLPLGWLLLGVAVYPTLLLLGWVYVRRAERNERDFAELVSEADR
ncbi:hypothetical protein [Nocardioides caricicola]|uniref:DUF485 domain-containing protein n=1 Tax=Nocardioides caricicola TaxID=634770 RepID=A0ABW0N2Q1_9ACTN